MTREGSGARAIRVNLRSPLRLGPQIIAALAARPITVKDICRQLAVKESVASRWIKSLEEVGMVRVAGYGPRAANNVRPALYKLQSEPFARADAEEPEQGFARKHQRGIRVASVFDLAASMEVA